MENKGIIAAWQYPTEWGLYATYDTNNHFIECKWYTMRPLYSVLILLYEQAVLGSPACVLI